MTRLGEAVQRILIVEDEAEIRRFARMSLVAEGFEVIEAEGVQRGLIEAGTRRPDLVVLDLGLPDGDGIELIRDLRAWSDMPVLVLSARTTESGKINALDAGADDYLVKPLSAVRLSLTRQGLRPLTLSFHPVERCLSERPRRWPPYRCRHRVAREAGVWKRALRQGPAVGDGRPCPLARAPGSPA